MDRAIRIAKTVALVAIRAIELVVRTYVYLINPLLCTVLALLLSVFKGENSKPTYEERVNDWCHILIIDFIDWFNDKQEILNQKLDNLIK